MLSVCLLHQRRPKCPQSGVGRPSFLSSAIFSLPPNTLLRPRFVTFAANLTPPAMVGLTASELDFSSRPLPPLPSEAISLEFLRFGFPPAGSETGPNVFQARLLGCPVAKRTSCVVFLQKNLTWNLWLFSFGKRNVLNCCRSHDCLCLQESEMIVVSLKLFQRFSYLFLWNMYPFNFFVFIFPSALLLPFSQLQLIIPNNPVH